MTIEHDIALARERAALRPDPGTSLRHPTFHPGQVVTAVAPALRVGGLPAHNWTGVPLEVGDVVVLAVDQGRRMVIGTTADIADYVDGRGTSIRSRSTTTNQTIPGATFTAVSMTHTEHAPASAEWMTVTNTTVTIQRAGIFQVEGGVYWAGGTSGSAARQVVIAVNGGIRARSQLAGDGAGVLLSAHQVSRTIRLEVGDEVQIQAWHNAGSGVAVRGDLPETFRAVRLV